MADGMDTFLRIKPNCHKLVYCALELNLFSNVPIHQHCKSILSEKLSTDFLHECVTRLRNMKAFDAWKINAYKYYAVLKISETLSSLHRLSVLSSQDMNVVLTKN